MPLIPCAEEHTFLSRFHFIARIYADIKAHLFDIMMRFRSTTGPLPADVNI